MSEPSPIRNPGWIWGIALIAVGLFLFRYGYAFGFSDQDEFLPLAARILDKDLFLSDWFVSMQFEGFSIRWPMALLVALPAAFLPVWSVVFLLHLGTAMVSAIAVARLSHRIFHFRFASLATVVAVMAITTRWSPGGNDILHAMLVPSSVAWCLILSAVERFHARRFVVAGLLLGCASLFHPLLGLQAGGLMVLVSMTWSAISGRQRIRLALPWLLCLVPLIVLLFSVGTASPEATTILTDLRAPHHYLPTSFSSSTWLLLSGVLATAIGFLWFDSNRGTPDAASVNGPQRTAIPISRWDRSFLSRMLLIPVGVLAISLLLTVWPMQWQTAIRLQPWAVSPLVRVLGVLTGIGFSVVWLQSRWHHPGASYTNRAPGIGIDRVAPILGVLVLAFGLRGSLDDVHGVSHPDQDLHEWAAENSDIDAVFVIPPSMSGFQYGAKRAQYVSFKSFPFAASPTLEWWARLQEIAPVPLGTPGGLKLLARMDSSYHHQRISDLRPFVAARDVDFLVRPEPDPGGWREAETPEWCSDRWCVYWAGRILTQPVRPASP